MQNNNKKYFNKALALSYSQCCCEDPVLIRSPHGKLFYVGCGQCPKCKQKRRSSWSRRLMDERDHPLCFHAYGFTLTYDTASVPYLWYNDLKEGDYSYEDGYKTPHLAMHRGCNAKYFKRFFNPAVSLLNFDDIQRFVAAFKKWLYENSPYHDFVELEKPKKYLDLQHYKKTGEKIYKEVTKVRVKGGNWFTCSYYIAGEYGYSESASRKTYENIDPNKLIEKHTSRGHYHGIMYIYCRDQEILDKLNKDFKDKLYSIRKDFETYLLRKWKHSKQRYDSRKGIFYGKSIQEFGKNWGDYLGSYVNKTTLSMLARGSEFVPERVLCSHNLGINWCQKKENYRRYMKELALCQKYGTRFNPTVLIDDKEKPLPKRYRNWYIEQFFRIKIGKYAKWVRQENYKNKQLPDVLYRKNVPFVPQGYFDSDYVKVNSYYNWLDTNRQFYDYVSDLKTITLTPRYVQDKRKLERYSIYRMPNDNTYNIDDFIEFSKKEVRRFERFCVFIRFQTDLLLDELYRGEDPDDELCYDFDGLAFSSMLGDTHDSILSFCNTTYSQNREICVNIRKFALDKKRIHEKRNKYV